MSDASLVEKRLAHVVEAGWISPEQALTLRRIVGFRNVLVHRYIEVDGGVVRSIVERHLDDLLEFVRIVRIRTRP